MNTPSSPSFSGIRKMMYGLVKDLINSQGAVSFRCVELTDPHTACSITCTITQIVKLCSVVHRLQ